MGAGLAVQNVMFGSFGLQGSERGVQWIDEGWELTSAGIASKHYHTICDVIEGTEDSGFVVSGAVGGIDPSGIQR